MAENELIVYGENGEIVECGFDRVDFTNPPSLISYGDSVIEELANVLESTSQLILETPQEQVDSKIMQEITTFDQTLDKSAEKINNPGLVDKAKRGLSSVLSKLGINALEDALQEESLANQYREQREKLSEVKEILVRQNERIFASITLTSEIIKTMQPLIKKFDTMIEVAKEDLKKFRSEIDALAATADPQDERVKNAIRVRVQTADFFEKQLNELQNMSVTYDQTVAEYQLQQITDMSLVSTKTSQIKHGIPVLETQAGLMVKNKEQQQAIAEAKALNDAINNAVKKNAGDLLTNIEGALQLEVNGGITGDTIASVNSTITKAVEVYKNRDKMIKEKIAKDSQIREKVKADRNKTKQAILGLFEDSFLIDGNDASITIIENTPQKQIGSK